MRACVRVERLDLEGSGEGGRGDEGREGGMRGEVGVVLQGSYVAVANKAERRKGRG